jgi:hypothetical protein
MVPNPLWNICTQLQNKEVTITTTTILNVLIIYYLAQCLVKAWGTDLLSDIGHFGTMVLVRLPDGLLGLSVDMPRTSNDVERVQDTLHNKCKIEVPVKLLQGKLYIRISAHIYNDLKDYERVAQAILELCDD